jgi:hypothetical protein
VTDFCTGCICGCRRGLANRPGGKCVRCKVGDMPPGLARSVATALLPLINSDLPEPADGVVWMDGRSAGPAAVTGAKATEPTADIEAA